MIYVVNERNRVVREKCPPVSVNMFTKPIEKGSHQNRGSQLIISLGAALFPECSQCSSRGLSWLSLIFFHGKKYGFFCFHYDYSLLPVFPMFQHACTCIHTCEHPPVSQGTLPGRLQKLVCDCLGACPGAALGHCATNIF